MNGFTHLTEIRFQSLGLHPLLLQSLDSAGFSHCTPIQAQALPLALQGKDIAGQAQTGTGKTAAFLLAAMHRLLSVAPVPGRAAHQPRALVLAPTRELAVQIHQDARRLGQHTDLKCVVVYGGAGYESQRQAIRAGVDLLIGTPGRVIDYFKQRVFDLKAAQTVILDEADRMFDLGFIADVRYLLRHCPPPASRQNLLFSATLSPRVLELAYEHMNDPLPVRIEPQQVTAEGVRQRVYYVANDEKIQALIGLLKHLEAPRTLLFVNTKSGAEHVHRWLEGNGFKAAVLSGDVPQPKRLKLLARFASGELPILVATDVAARGLHIPGVSHVINFDLPQDAEDYVHRIGRTARAGASGDAISLACETYAFSLPDIERFIGQKIPQEPIPAAWLVSAKPPIRRERHGFSPDHHPARQSDSRGRRCGKPRNRLHGHRPHDRGH